MCVLLRVQIAGGEIEVVRKKSVMLILGLFLCFSISYVQADQKEELVWEDIVTEAHKIQKHYAGKQAEYQEIRADFLTVFTREAMMEIFMEHLMIEEDTYQLAATDFSPFIVPNLNWTSFEVEKATKDEVTLMENVQETELMSPERIQRKITLTKTEDGWRISDLDWKVTNPS